ncbi:hypothetical protein Taro_024216, partial [Colocasia esculenta]|nr:hypothetical protein [Colocasia esculenta]
TKCTFVKRLLSQSDYCRTLPVHRCATIHAISLHAILSYALLDTCYLELLRSILINSAILFRLMRINQSAIYSLHDHLLSSLLAIHVACYFLTISLLAIVVIIFYRDLTLVIVLYLIHLLFEPCYLCYYFLDFS